MKLFLIRVGIFALLLFGTLQAIGWALIKTSQQGHSVENSRIYLCLEKARHTWPESEVFVLGDSVANQMYPPETNNGRIQSLALVMPCTLAGQYFLLRRLAETNDLRGKSIVLVLSPEGFAGEFSHSSTYHYVLKPFHNDEFKPWQDAFYQKRVLGNIVSALSQLPMIKCSNWNPPSWIPYLDTDNIVHCEGLSPFAVHYLKCIEALTEAHGATLRVLPTIQPESEVDREYLSLREGVRRVGLHSLFQEYFTSFHYFPNNAFRDSAHVKNRNILGPNIFGL